MVTNKGEKMKVYGSRYEISTLLIPGYEFEVLNELKDLSKRSDENCLYHTRFLFEIDSMSLEDQRELIEKVKPLLVRVVYSGSKSYHCIVEFDKKYEKECELFYKEIWRTINKNYFDSKCDTQCINPSRLTRTPNVIRKDTGKNQELVYDCPSNTFSFAKDVIREAKSLVTSMLIRATQNARPVYRNNNVDCSKWDVVKRYLETPFPKQTGNGHSSSWLYAALQTTKKYGDNVTQQMIIEKAKREGWTDREIEHKLK